MLRSFRLANHRSFADEQELLLMPSSPRDDRPVVPVTAIYGANASGKSNLLDGLGFMHMAVLQSFARWDAEGPVPRLPFRLSLETRSEPSLYSVELISNGVPYVYGFTLDDNEIIDEWLYSYPEKRKRILFDRTGGDIKFGTTVGRSLRSRLELLEDITRPNALFLSACAQVKTEEVMPVYRWFRRLQIRSSSHPHPRRIAEQVARLLTRNPEALDRLKALLVSADVGITDVVIEETEDQYRLQRLRQIRSRIRDLERMIHAPSLDDQRARALNVEIEQLRGAESEALKRSELRPELKFVHGVSDEQFDPEDESAGTISWLAMLPMVLEALDEGYVVAVDEIDTSLHPLLTAQLVRLFNSPETNPNNAQLIFTSHDSTLLGTMIGERTLDRDEIWFVEKNKDGRSSLYPLSDFKVRNDQNTERRYLGGSYGAVPVLDAEDFAEAVLGR